MNKLILSIALVLIAGAFALVVWSAGGKRAERIEVLKSEPTTFAAGGVGTSSAPGLLYLVYDAPERSGSQTVALTFDALSVCVTEAGAVPCLNMSAAPSIQFAQRRVAVEGMTQGTSTVLVRKLSALREGEPERMAAPGSVFISWEDAVRLIEACEPEMIMQTHALDVYLDLGGGETVRAVEPSIDEVFRVIERTRQTCGTIPVATE